MCVCVCMCVCVSFLTLRETVQLALTFHRHGSVEAWLDRHNVDILCLQEVKVTATRLAEQPKLAGITPSLCSYSFAHAPMQHLVSEREREGGREGERERMRDIDR